MKVPCWLALSHPDQGPVIWASTQQYFSVPLLAQEALESSATGCWDTLGFLTGVSLLLQLGEVSCETVPCRPVCTDPSCPGKQALSLGFLVIFHCKPCQKHMP